MIFVWARGLVAAGAAKLLDIVVVAEVSSCVPWVMPLEFALRSRVSAG